MLIVASLCTFTFSNAQLNSFSQFESCIGSNCNFTGMATSLCGTSQASQGTGLNFNHSIMELDCNLNAGEGNSSTKAFVNLTVVNATIKDLFSASIPFAFRSVYQLENASTDCDVSVGLKEQSTSRYNYPDTQVEIIGESSVTDATSASRQFILPEPKAIYYSYTSTQEFEVSGYSVIGQNYECNHTGNIELQLLIPDQFSTDNGIITQPVLIWGGIPITIRKECAKVIDLKADTLDSYIYSARDTLFSSSIIPSEGIVEFRSNQDIVLEEGFEIELGADFVVSEYEACL